MAGMFRVRARATPWPATLRSWLFSCTLLAPLPPPTPSRLHLAPHAAPFSPRPPLATRQNAAAFNQSLNFDTSSVKDMSVMFGVRSTRAPLASDPLQLAPSLHAACAARHAPPSPPSLPPTPHAALSPRPPLATWQYAAAFNQPLNFDTSSVTDMNSMFGVRSARAPPSPATLRSWLPPCTRLSPPPPPPTPSRLPPTPHAAPSLHALPLPHSAGCL